MAHLSCILSLIDYDYVLQVYLRGDLMPSLFFSQLSVDGFANEKMAAEVKVGTFMLLYSCHCISVGFCTIVTIETMRYQVAFINPATYLRPGN